MTSPKGSGQVMGKSTMRAPARSDAFVSWLTSPRNSTPGPSMGLITWSKKVRSLRSVTLPAMSRRIPRRSATSMARWGPLSGLKRPRNRA